MNNRLYGNLIFELSQPGRRAYSLPETEFPEYPVSSIPAALRRAADVAINIAPNINPPLNI